MDVYLIGLEASAAWARPQEGIPDPADQNRNRCLLPDTLVAGCLGDAPGMERGSGWGGSKEETALRCRKQMEKRGRSRTVRKPRLLTLIVFFLS